MRRALIVALLLTGACGDDEPKASTEIRVAATRELRFVPDRIESWAGQRVTFVVENTSPMEHEFVIGDADFHAEHDKGEHGGHGADGGKAVTVKPGETARLTFTMPKSAPTFACYVDDHDAAGMKGTVAYRQPAEG